jgi:membrane protein
MGEMPRMAAQSDQAFGSGAITGLLIAVWSASKGIQGAMRAVGPSSAAAISLNRLRRVGVAVVLAGGGLVVIVAAVAVVAAFPALLERLGLSHVRALTIGIFRWPAFAAIVFAWLSALYKYAPDKHPPWREVAPGALAATFVWLAGSIAFSTYVTRFGGQAVIYGSLAAAAALLIWFLLAAYALLLGSELNAALTPEAQSTIAAPAR